MGTGVCPLSVHVEDEQCCYSKPSKSKIRIHIWTVTPISIKEGHIGENRKYNHNPIQSGYRYLPRCSERLNFTYKRHRKERHRRSQDCGPRAHQGNFHSIVHITALCFMSTEYVMKRKQAQWVDDHTNTARVKRSGSHMVHLCTHGTIR